jgi:hypothetical protein
MNAVVFLAQALLAIQPAGSQDRKTVPSREFVIKVDSKREAPTFRVLWVSRDGGKTWKLAKDAGVSEAWGDWAEGVIRCTVRVPEEGSYDFYAQLGDSVSNRLPEPQPGQPADPRLRCDVREQGALSWEYPRGRVEWTGGQAVTLRWASHGPEFRERSAELQYALGDEAWVTITRGLDAPGTYSWIVPNKETSALRLRIRAQSPGAREVSAESDPVSIRATQRPNIAEARALYDRARVLHAQQRFTEAQLKYEASIAAWPDFGEVFNDLGKLHFDQKEYARALEYYLRARKACPSDPIAYVNGARAEAQLGLYEDALADLRDASDLGLEREERTAVLAAETLWLVAKAASATQDWKRVRESCELIVRIRLAPRTLRARAQQSLEWLKTQGTE